MGAANVLSNREFDGKEGEIEWECKLLNVNYLVFGEGEREEGRYLRTSDGSPYLE